MKTKILQLNREKIAFWFLVGVLFLCAGMYMYLINSTVRNVVMREKYESQISELSLSNSNSEFEYINKQNAINLSLAYSLGFKDANEKKFVSKNSVSLVSYRTNEI